MNLEQVKAFLEDNKDNQEVTDYIKVLSQVTPESVESFLEQKEGKKLLQPKLDKYHTKGLDSWKTNNLDKLIADKMKELNPAQSPEQIELAQIKQQLTQIENEKTREVLKNKALTVATEKNIPTSVIDYLIGADEESTVANLGTFETAMKSYVDLEVKTRISDSSYVPPAGNDGAKVFTKEQVSAMSVDEINKNWDDIKDII